MTKSLKKKEAVRDYLHMLFQELQENVKNKTELLNEIQEIKETIIEKEKNFFAADGKIETLQNAIYKTRNLLN